MEIAIPDRFKPVSAATTVSYPQLSITDSAPGSSGTFIQGFITEFWDWRYITILILTLLLSLQLYLFRAYFRLTLLEILRTFVRWFAPELIEEYENVARTEPLEMMAIDIADSELGSEHSESSASLCDDQYFDCQTELHSDED